MHTPTKGSEKARSQVLKHSLLTCNLFYHPLKVYFKEQKFLILLKSILSFFFDGLVVRLPRRSDSLQGSECTEREEVLAGHAARGAARLVMVRTCFQSQGSLASGALAQTLHFEKHRKMG